jgi:AbrB family looped-hinge helix DNA binding protein
MRTKISKGFQTVVPKEIRKKLDLVPGDSVIWEEKDDGTIVVKPKKRRSLDEVVGMISAGGDAVDDKERVRRGEF